MRETKRFECVADFYVDKYDGDGFWTEEQTLIRKGEVFECDLGDSERIVGGRNTLRLVNEKHWLEITEDTIRENFVEKVE